MKKQVALALSLVCLCAMTRAAYAADNGTEFFLEDDLTVFGVTGTSLDPDAEIKGFTVFGSTQASYAGLVEGPGNVVVNGQLWVASGTYFSGNSTFTANMYVAGASTFSNAANMYIPGGADNQVLAWDSVDSSLKWSDVSTMGGDSLGTHVATKTLDMKGYNAVNVGSITFSGASNNVFVSSTSAALHGGLYVSTHVYAAGGLQAVGQLIVGDKTTLVGSTSISTLSVTGASTFTGTMYMTGISTFTNRIYVSSDIVINSLAATDSSILTLRANDAANYLQVSRQGPSASGYTANIELKNLSLVNAGGNAGAMMLQVLSSTNMYFATNNQERMRIGSSGNVGIGSKNPVGMFQVGGGTLTVLNSGAVGIGTLSPQAALDVVSTGTLATQYAQIWRDSDGVVKASMSATGAFTTVDAITLGNNTASPAPAGTIRYNSSNFQGYDGAVWKNFDVSGGGWTNSGGLIYPGTLTDLVGIGVSPTGHKLQVQDTTNSNYGQDGIYSFIEPPAAYVYQSFGVAGSKAAVRGVASSLGTPENGLFGVAGYLNSANQQMSAGVFGAANLGGIGTYPDTWGALGYRDSTPSEWAGYFNGNVRILTGDMVLGNGASTPPAGGIRWNGSHFLGYTGTQWRSFDIGSGVATYIVAASNSRNKEQADYICDGTADQIEINAALAALGSGGVVYLLDGTYTLASDIVIALQNSKLVGAGRSSILKRGYTGAVNGLIHIFNSNVAVKDLNIDNSYGGATTNDNGILLNAGGLSDIVMQNLYVHGAASSGYGLYTSGAIMRVTVKDNYFSGNYAGLYLNTLSYGHVTGNVIDNSPQEGIYLTGSNYNIISQNTLTNTINGGIYAWNSGNNSIAWNTIQGSTGGEGIQLDGSAGTGSSNSNISNNTISDCSGAGIYSAESFNNVIAANRISDCGGAGTGTGIQLASSDNNSVTENLLTEPSVAGAAIMIDINSDSNFLAGNTYSGYAITSPIQDLAANTQYGSQKVLSSYIFLSSPETRVGIGTTTPSSMLHLVSANAGITNALTLERVRTDPSGFGIRAEKARGVVGGLINVNNDDELLNIQGLGWNSTAMDYQSGAFIRFLVDGTPGNTATDMPGRIEFATTQNDTSSPQTGMVLKSSGAVGIGTINPDARLEVRAAAGENYILKISSKDGGPMMAVTKDGRVGIDTFVPAGALHVSTGMNAQVVISGGSNYFNPADTLNGVNDTHGLVLHAGQRISDGIDVVDIVAMGGDSGNWPSKINFWTKDEGAAGDPKTRLTISSNGAVSSQQWMISGCANPNDPNDMMVPVGDFCVDKYEATVWSTPTGGTQYGAASDNYLCTDDGQTCGNGGSNPIYARSVPTYTPSRYITWFQANAACDNSGKHLLTNAEWQSAVRGTVDPGASGTPPNCNTGSAGPTNTGGGTNCLSSAGAENMVGSLEEWVADWQVNTSTGGSTTWGPGGDAAYVGPNYITAMIRGGAYNSAGLAGIFAVNALNNPYSGTTLASLGFRCGRRR